MRQNAEKKGRIFRRANQHENQKSRPPYSQNIKFLAGISNLFANGYSFKKEDGRFMVPSCFSLLENYKESFQFLKRLFNALYQARVQKIILDYSQCTRIDVDASICMDLILAEFIHYRNICRKRGLRQLPHSIEGRGFNNNQVKRVLFSIGAYRNISGINLSFDDVLPLPVLINNLNAEKVWAQNEIDLTKIVEYIKACLKKMNRELTADSESEFYKVIGEVMSNAEEHSTMPARYAIGFFQEFHENNQHYGVFNFSIFNFGKTIYDTFKSPDCKNPKAVQQMEELSRGYTKKGWFRKADFEEETLWTLYAMQEGVTSKEKKRGNGSIQYIENFFKLRGNEAEESEALSKMVVISGNSRILFDGTYGIKTKENPGGKKPFKMITFNESGKIEDQPDKKYVTFAPHYFPGTIISARILIKDNNTNLADHAE